MGLGDGIALSVHGPLGAVDLMVPAGAHVADVAREYAEQVGLSGEAVPQLCTRVGRSLPATASLAEAEVGTGAVLVATGPVTAAERRPVDDHRRAEPPSAGVADSSRWGTGSLVVAAAAALVGAALAARLPDPETRTAVVAALGAATLLALLPVGRLAARRAVAAPVFGFAATLVPAWDPAPERMPTVLGVAALAAAVVAAVGAALQPAAATELRVWMVAGVGCFAASSGAALAGFAPPVVWAGLLVLAMLAARLVPMSVVDVPDQYLVDLERLAVTAWSAREQPRGRRGRIVVPRQAVAEVAEHGNRTLVASSGAVLAVAAVAAPLLLATATLPVDRVGARCLVGFAGVSLLLVARSYRHVAARLLLRLAGLSCLAWLVVALAGEVAAPVLGWVVVVSSVVAGLLVVVAVAVGRGWRSAWWSRRAEVAEGVAGAFALGSVVVAVGLFRRLWEMTGQGLGG